MVVLCCIYIFNYISTSTSISTHKMAKAKARTTVVHLISTAKTGYKRSILLPRTSDPIAQIKYDPIAQRHVLFKEEKKRKGMLAKPLDFTRGAFDWKKKK